MNYIDKKLVSFLFFVSVFFMLQGCGKMAVVSNVEILGTSDSIVLETDTFNTYKYNVSVLNEVILSDSVKGRKTFGLKDLLKRQIMDKYSLAYYLVNNNMKVPVRVLITNVKDTTLFVNFQYSPMQNVNANITGICAPLKCSNQDDKLWDNVRRWAYQHRKQMRNDILLKFRDVLFELNRTKYYEYVTNERVPIVNDLTNLKYKVQSDLKAKYYYLYATCSQNELDKFVEDMVVKNYSNSLQTGNGIFPCYANAGTSGYKCLTLIGINEDWSYSICPLGLIATDLRAPFIEDDFVNFGFAEIIVLVFHQNYSLSNFPAFKFIRTCSHRSTEKVGLLHVLSFKKVSRKHRHAHIFGECSIRFRKLKGNRRVIDDVYFLHVFIVRSVF